MNDRNGEDYACVKGWIAINPKTKIIYSYTKT